LQLIIKLYEIKNKIIIEGLTILSEIFYGSLKDQAHNDHYINNWNNQKKNIFQCLKVIFTFPKRPKSQTMRPTLKFSAIFVFSESGLNVLKLLVFLKYSILKLTIFGQKWPKSTGFVTQNQRRIVALFFCLINYQIIRNDYWRILFF